MGEAKSKQLQRRENKAPPPGGKGETKLLERIKGLGDQVRALQEANKKLKTELGEERESLARERGKVKDLKEKVKESEEQEAELSDRLGGGPQEHASPDCRSRGNEGCVLEGGKHPPRRPRHRWSSCRWSR